MQTLSIASWNMHQGIHNDGGAIDIIGRVDELDADVLIVQEGWWAETSVSFAGELAAAFGYEFHEVDALQAPQGRYSTRAVTVFTRHGIDDRGEAHLEGTAQYNRRPVVWIETAGVRVGGTHLHGIHLLRRGHVGPWRRELAALATTARDANLDVVAGDCNIWSPPVRRALGHMTPAVRGRTWPARLRHSQIDHMMFGPRLSLVAGRVLPNLDSDHRPIRAEFEVDSQG